MAAVARGARSSPRASGSDVVGILPTTDAGAANAWVDVVVPTGLGHARNVVVVASADAVVAVGGAAGTLSELALAWQLGRPVVALATHGGWAADLAGRAVDARRDDVVHAARTPADAVRLALELSAAAPEG